MHCSGFRLGIPSGRCIIRQRGRVQILFFYFVRFYFILLFIYLFCLLEGVRSPSSTPLNTPLDWSNCRFRVACQLRCRFLLVYSVWTNTFNPICSDRGTTVSVALPLLVAFCMNAALLFPSSFFCMNKHIQLHLFWQRNYSFHCFAVVSCFLYERVLTVSF